MKWVSKSPTHIESMPSRWVLQRAYLGDLWSLQDRHKVIFLHVGSLDAMKKLAEKLSE
jgi:hypothetical protein